MSIDLEYSVIPPVVDHAVQPTSSTQSEMNAVVAQPEGENALSNLMGLNGEGNANGTEENVPTKANDDDDDVVTIKPPP